ncbi:unnamed protein product [Symbiodinium natans]|uniref:Uncharacterized protein n=1 Tax=Symbiodinium natans TaxID=878477 RepID=A0A812NTJ0_9DINO|nr:unnamed protein product [Symbiodinium natans]
MAAGLSSEEFVRLQQELLYLKMKTEELRDENARSLRHFQETQAASHPSGVDALRKAGAGAVTAIGQRAASLKSSLSDGASFQAFQAAKDSILHPEADAATAEAREEVHSLQERLKAAMEELASARNDAMSAQRAATAPCAEEPEESGSSSKVQRGGQAEDGMTVLLFKVQQQQKELERVREAVDQQQAQIGRLTEKAAADKSRPKGSPRLSDLEEQLRSSEGKLDQLGRRLQSSQGSSRLTYELQCHLESVLSQVRKRDAAIESLLLRQERMEHRGVLQRERLAFAQEDILSQVLEYDLDDVPQVVDATGPQFSECFRQDDCEAQHLDEDVVSISNQSHQAAGVQVCDEDTADLEWEVSGLAASPTWSRHFEGDGPSMVDLEEELQGLRAAAEDARRREAEQAETLRAQIRQRQQQMALPAAKPEAEAPNSQGPVEAVESSGLLYALFLGAKTTTGLTFMAWTDEVQKIEELEQQNIGLEQDLDLLASSRSACDFVIRAHALAAVP